MTQDNLVVYLILATFALVLVFGVYQWFRTRRATRNHEHSAVEKTQVSHDVRAGETRAHR